MWWPTQGNETRLVGASSLHWESTPKPGQLVGMIDSDAQVDLMVSAQNLEALDSSLLKDLECTKRKISGLMGRLANSSLADKAPGPFVQECRVKLAVSGGACPGGDHTSEIVGFADVTKGPLIRLYDGEARAKQSMHFDREIHTKTFCCCQTL